MSKSSEHDPVLRMIEALLGDLSVRSATYVGRRPEDGDVKTFVIQTGEEGRFRLSLPDLNSDGSIQRLVASAQAHVAEVLGVPVPLCPRHPHPLVAAVAQGQLTWACPNSEWRCGLGDYAEMSWPQFDVESLAPILAARIQRRGITGVVTIGVRLAERGPVAEFGVAEERPELVQELRDAAAPLPINVHQEPRQFLRVGAAGLIDERQRVFAGESRLGRRTPSGLGPPRIGDYG